MDKCNYDFVIMVKGKASFVHGLIMEHQGEFETNRSCAIKEHTQVMVKLPSVGQNHHLCISE